MCHCEETPAGFSKEIPGIEPDSVLSLAIIFVLMLKIICDNMWFIDSRIEFMGRVYRVQ